MRGWGSGCHGIGGVRVVRARVRCCVYESPVSWGEWGWDWGWEWGITTHGVNKRYDLSSRAHVHGRLLRNAAAGGPAEDPRGENGTNSQ